MTGHFSVDQPSLQSQYVNAQSGGAPMSFAQGPQVYMRNPIATTNLMAFQQETTYIPGHLHLQQQSQPQSHDQSRAMVPSPELIPQAGSGMSPQSMHNNGPATSSGWASFPVAPSSGPHA
jgi:hypothetical protein